MSETELEQLVSTPTAVTRIIYILIGAAFVSGGIWAVTQMTINRLSRDLDRLEGIVTMMALDQRENKTRIVNNEMDIDVIQERLNGRSK